MWGSVAGPERMTNRREWLKMSGGGLGALAFDCLRAEETHRDVHHPR